MKGYIDVNDLLAYWNDHNEPLSSDERFKFWSFLNDLKKIQITKCKDCVHWHDATPFGGKGHFCELTMLIRAQNDYCSSAEKREKAEK
ncbi:MAG: hypothetical protein J6S67_07450 [Methanobrevibacter sp.]|nr:hypothetical protein [Methanobrevibacter sp.]